MSNDENTIQPGENEDSMGFLAPFAPKAEDNAPDPAHEVNNKPGRRQTTAEKAAADQPTILAEEVLPGEQIISIDPKLIDKNPYQNRVNFNKRKLQELADNIKEKGQISPCVVRRMGSRFQLVAGERRWRACIKAEINVNVVVRDINNEMMRTICHAENEKREDTNMIEKYLGARSLMVDEGMSREDAIREFKMSQTTYSRISKIENLPEDFIPKLAESAFSVQLNPYRIEEIGKLFRDNEDHAATLLEMLKQDIENFEHLPFDSDHEQYEETNKTTMAFVKKAKAIIKPAHEPKASEKPKEHDYEYSVDGRVVGSAKLNSRHFSIKLSKEDLPQDMLDKFILHVEEFFNVKSADPVGDEA